MATRQYIGARYVPAFYENSDGTAEWRAGVAYEPLTIVTWNGNSYTSKRIVPANIGSPSENPQFWVATGMYNTQIEALSEQIASFDVSKMSHYNTLADMIADASLENGSCCRTLGYHAVNDCGGSLYLISDTYGAYYHETLDNGLYAILVLDNNALRFEQVGAYGDDTHDDTSAIQAALDLSITCVGNIGKTYKVTSTLNISADYKKIFTYGEGIIRKAAFSVDNSEWANTDVLLNVTGKGVEIEGFNFEGAQSKGIAIKADYGDNNTDISVRLCRFHLFYSAMESKGRGPIFERNRIVATRRGIVLSTYPGNPSEGIFGSTVMGGRGARIDGNRAQALGSGNVCYLVTFEEGSFFGASVTNNLVESRAGLVYCNPAATLRNCLISDNVVIGDNNNESLITLAGNTDCIISSNQLNGLMSQDEYTAAGGSETITQTQPTKVIAINGVSKNLIIQGNVIENSTSYGFDILNDFSGIIFGNVFKNAVTAAIYVRKSFRGVIDGNSLEATFAEATKNFLRFAANSALIGKINIPEDSAVTASGNAYLDVDTNYPLISGYYTRSGVINGHISTENGFSPAARQDSHAYALGNRMSYGGYTYICTVAGTSAASAPAFNTDPASLTTDGTATFLCASKMATILV